jgi:hypothetical protein
MGRRIGLAIAVTSVILLVTVSFASSMMQVNAAGQSGSARFVDTAGKDVTTTWIGCVVNIKLTGSGGAGDSYFRFTLKKPAGSIAASDTYYDTALSTTVTYTLLSTDPTGTWTAVLEYIVIYPKSSKTLSADTVTVSANSVPKASISSFPPNPSNQWTSVSFSGSGIDTDGSIAGWSWRSSINGQLSTAASFSTSALSTGTHTIYFKVKDNRGAYSPEVSQQLVIRPAPVAKINSITPTTAVPGASISFSGSGTDPNNQAITAYNWRSSVDGSLSGYASFSSTRLSPGVHTIYFKVMNSLNAWSLEVTSTVTVDDNDGAALAQDLDPYVNLKITVAIWEVQEIEKVDGDTGFPPHHDPADFYWKITVGSLSTVNPSNSGPFTSNSDHLGGSGATTQLGSYEFDVSDSSSSPTVQVKIELWDDEDGPGKTADNLCDISRTKSFVNSLNNMAGRTAIMTYDLRTGDWGGGTSDDGFSGDSNGIGHVSGTEDGSSASVDQDDCEMWFWIYQNDFDADGLTYQEELAKGYSPKVCNNVDLDQDGLMNSEEYVIHSKAEDFDSDRDGIPDGYEYNYDGTPDLLNPVSAGGASDWLSNVSDRIANLRDAMNAYGNLLSWDILEPLFPSTDIGYMEVINSYTSHTSNDEITKLEWLSLALGAFEVFTVPPPLMPAVFALALMQWMIEKSAVAMANCICQDFDEFHIYWNGYGLPYFNVMSWPSIYGIAPQIGYGLQADETISIKLLQLSSYFSDMKTLVAPSNKVFFLALPIVNNARGVFGALNSATPGSTPLTLHVKQGNGIESNEPVIDANDPNHPYLAQYSDLELLIYNFGAMLQTYVGGTYVLTWTTNPDVTVGMVAQELVNFAYYAFMLLKTERLFLDALYSPI